MAGSDIQTLRVVTSVDATGLKVRGWMVICHAGALVIDVVRARGGCDLAEPCLLSWEPLGERPSHDGADSTHRDARCIYNGRDASVGRER